MTTAQLRRWLKHSVDRLSPQRLLVAADFVAYLEERESNEATEELLQMPGLADALKRAQGDAETGNLVDWRAVRDDV